MAGEFSNTKAYWGSQEGQEILLMKAFSKHKSAV